MVFDNRQIVTKLNTRRYIAILLYLVGISLVIFTGFFDKNVLGYQKSFYAIILSVVYILYIVFAYLMNYNFVSFSDDGDKLIFKFISLRPFNNEKKAIEIKKSDFSGFKMEKSFFNLKSNLILSIKTKKGVAKYPAIGISALSDKHKMLLVNSLNQLT